jgi:hypothetical protein
MEKLDLKKELANLYKASNKKMKIVQVPRMKFLRIDGEGDPNTSEDYAAATTALCRSSPEKLKTIIRQPMCK